MKNISDSIGNRTRDLPACNSLPQPTAPIRTCTLSLTNVKAFEMFPSRHDFRLLCAFIIAGEMNYVDDDGATLQDYKILEYIWFSLVFSD